MDSKTRNTTIFLVLSLFALAVGIVLVSNRDTGSAVSKNAVSESQIYNYVNGDGLSEEQLHAFLKDEAFFDYDSNYQAYSKESVDSSTLYLVANSVDHDIRIAITDVYGHAVKGVPFVVNIDGVGEFKDANQDGIITIPDLSSGDYYVSLAPVDNYSVPSAPLKVTVKDKLEYRVIDDISYYIYTEDMIDFLSEDTREELSAEDADEGAYTINEDRTSGVFGIDVSKYQKDIDWDKVAASGVKFVIIRCGYRGSKSGVLVEDPYFKQNIKGAQAAGLDVGVYFFSQATNETEAVEEASMVATLCKDYNLTYPAFIDIEGAGGGRADNLSKEERTNIIIAYCKTVESSGYIPGVYSSRYWYNNKIDDSRITEFVIWDAEYRSSPLYTGPFKIWQYSSKGNIDGISTYVDLNMCYSTFNQ